MENEFTPLMEAEQAETLRNQLTGYAADAVKYGNVDRDWVNAQLNRLGAPLVSGYATYRINTPVSGVFGRTIKAVNRAEALAVFNSHLARIRATGQTDGADVVYQLDVPEVEPTFFSGPQDLPTPEADVPDLAGLKVGIRSMLKDAVALRGWGVSYAEHALHQMGLEPLPHLTERALRVPVTGVAQLMVPVFEGDDEAAMQASAQALAERLGVLSVKPDEVGQILAPRSSGMELNLVDDDEDDGL